MTVDHVFSTARLDRMALRRRDPTWLAERLARPDSRVVPVREGRSLVRAGGGAAPATLSLGALGDPGPAALEEGKLVLLGVDTGTDVAYFAAPVDVGVAAGDLVERGRWVGLRRVAALLPDPDAGLLAYARAMVHWHRHHAFCGLCGSPTRVEEAGHLRRCGSEGCGALHFPRTDPAVIVAVIHDDRILLGHQESWDAGRYSVLAGFVEPGESLEQAVRREVMEETAVPLGAVRYHSSQPWPFPASLMVGFTAEAEDDRIRIDPEELADARWFRRGEIDEEVAAGNLVLSPEISISRRLIEDWRSRLAGGQVPCRRHPRS